MNKALLNDFDKKIILRALESYNIIDLVAYINDFNTVFYVAFFEREGIIFSYDFYYCEVEAYKSKRTSAAFLEKIQETLDAFIIDIDDNILKKNSVRIWDVDPVWHSLSFILNNMLDNYLNCKITAHDRTNEDFLFKFELIKKQARTWIVEGRSPYSVFNYFLRELDINNLEIVNKILDKAKFR